MSFILTGTGNNGFRHRYSIKKDKNFIKAFVKFMVDLDFDEEEIKKGFSGEDEKGNFIELSIDEFEDCIREYENKKYDIDIFFGKAKVIAVVRTKTRKPMTDHLEKKAKWVKPISAKKIKEGKKVSVPLQKIKNKNK